MLYKLNNELFLLKLKNVIIYIFLELHNNSESFHCFLRVNNYSF